MNIREYLEDELCIYYHISVTEVNDVVKIVKQNGGRVFGLCGLIESGLRSPGIVKEPDQIIIYDPAENRYFTLLIEKYSS